MIIRKTPKGDYIKVNNDVSTILCTKGYFPKYMDNDYIYYIKSIELVKFMEKEGLNFE